MGSPASGPDVAIADDPKMAYTEKVLEEKEQILRRYIQDNYSKIQNVERELSSLAMEVKLTAGPKKAALEHLRKLIEASTEKIKAARLKEEQARKVWETALKAVEAEEMNKQNLCDDLKCLVQRSAEAQYSRLQELTTRLEALNPGLQGGASQVLGADLKSSLSNGSTMQQQGSKQNSSNIDGGSNVAVDGDIHPKVATTVASINSQKSPSAAGASPVATSPDPEGHAAGSEQGNVSGQTPRPVVRGQHVPVPKGRGGGARRIKGSLHLGRSKSETDNGGWTGAGFDVDDGQS